MRTRKNASVSFGSVHQLGEILVFADTKIKGSYLISNSSLTAIYGAGLPILFLEMIHEKSAICYICGLLN